MRALVVVSLAGVGIAIGAEVAVACGSDLAPGAIATDTEPTTSGCSGLDPVDFSRSRRVFEVGYVLGAGGLTRSGVGSVGSAFASLELSYGLQFGGNPDQPSYEIEVSGGAALQRTDGAVSTTGLSTRGALRMGPARVAASVDDTGRGNLGFFPMTFELSHAGELAARPRMSARPELARAIYHRERVELATRIFRAEGAGENGHRTDAPGLTKPRSAPAWAIDFFPLYSGLDVALQDATRIDATIGGSLLGVTEHTSGARIDLLELEHRRIDLAMIGTQSIDTVWMLKVTGVAPHTGSQYQVGWGQVIVTDELQALATFIDPEEGNLTIGGAGWYTDRGWGGFGLQYKREPYISMQGQIGLEDRLSGEVYVPRLLGLVARTFAARTTRWIDDAARRDVTAGVELGATYTRGGWSTKAGVEVGRTYYTALDNTLPTSAGFGAAFDLSVQRAGAKTWTR